MIKKSFSYLAKFPLPKGELKYQALEQVTDYQTGKEVILVEQLNPDFLLLFTKVKLIVTTQGSVLSHLAILAREFSLPLLKIKNKKEIKESGQLKINGKEIIFYD